MSSHCTKGFPSGLQLGSDVIKEHNILPYDGHAVLIDDSVTIAQAVLVADDPLRDGIRQFGEVRRRCRQG